MVSLLAVKIYQFYQTYVLAVQGQKISYQQWEQKDWHGSESEIYLLVYFTILVLLLHWVPDRSCLGL